ncbi:aliphatic sulfonate ABC transporter substrate-binding protein [Opitutaceae bacterium EW11]|nr:aliphatic sulfonate ABC transporter substrate-binding protein [Opitutaceae bacterium EW11]
MKHILLVGLSLFAASFAAAKTTLRIGYFPNVTHAQAIVAKAMAAEGKGWYEQRLGPDVELQWFTYNAGPSAMEAVFAGSIDLTYVGPNPALNAYIRSKGEEIRIVSGSARGGAALLVRPGSGIDKPADFKGKKLATPQLGNTQDVAARAWLKAQGFKITQLGGDVHVLPTANPDQLGLFQQGKIDAVWTVEPWVSRIEREAGGKVYLEQNDVVTTILVARVGFLSSQRELVERFVKAHRELTEWIRANPEEARRLVQKGLSAEVKREIKLELIESSWKRLTFDSAIALPSIQSVVDDARGLGFIRDQVDLSRLLAIPQ